MDSPRQTHASHVVCVIYGLLSQDNLFTIRYQRSNILILDLEVLTYVSEYVASSRDTNQDRTLLLLSVFSYSEYSKVVNLTTLDGII